jgi:ankyrin repeat protein
MCFECVACVPVLSCGRSLDYVAETISLLLSNRAISPNSIHPANSGTTALHLAASLGRADVVKVLLEQPDIDDTIKDFQGRTCLEVAKGKSVTKLIEGELSLCIVRQV